MSLKKILLIDDDEDDQLIFTDAVSELTSNVECDVANNGVEAITYLDSNSVIPSHIFLDLNMPRMNGFECLEIIKASKAFKNIPVTILSTSNDPSDRRKATRMGAERFISKTADFNELKLHLADILGIR